jgi:hypothetical protein
MEITKMANLTVDLTNKASMQIALTLIGMLMGGATPANKRTVEAPPEEAEMDLGMDLGMDAGVEDDGLDGLLDEPEPEPEGITVEGMKLALKELITAKGKDVALTQVKKAFGKLKVERMEDISAEKREAFVTFLKRSATE